MSNEDELRRAVTSAELRAAADYHDGGSSQEQVAADWILMAARHIELLQEKLAELVAAGGAWEQSLVPNTGNASWGTVVRLRAALAAYEEKT